MTVVVPAIETNDVRAHVEALDRAWRAATGNEALNEATWIDLDAPRPGSAGFLAAVDGRTAGYVHVARAEIGRAHV